jgi:hypothetical protein
VVNKARLVAFRNTGNSWFIEVPQDTVAALGWAGKKNLYLHCQLTDGIWISTKNDSAVMDEIVAITEQLGGHNLRAQTGKEP